MGGRVGLGRGTEKQGVIRDNRSSFRTRETDHRVLQPALIPPHSIKDSNEARFGRGHTLHLLRSLRGAELEGSCYCCCCCCCCLTCRTSGALESPW